MIVTKTKFEGVLIIEPTYFEDERGFFGSVWSEDSLRSHGVQANFVAGNMSYNKKQGTLRGMHYQAEPDGQSKLMCCPRGSVYDVGIDLRPNSPTFKQWIGIELNADNRLMLYLPTGFAHGYLTLANDSELSYLVSSSYSQEGARGVRWNDPAFAIDWPHQDKLIMVERDREYPDFKL